MLVLSRKPDEKILLPDLGITVEVIRVSGNRVKLGISAPENIRVLRGELVDDFVPIPTESNSHLPGTMPSCLTASL